MPTETEQSAPVKGRWGWYPCTKEEFLEIKEYHRLLLKDRRATRRFERWKARMSHNRTGTQPLCFGTSHDVYSEGLEFYRLLRRPAAGPEGVEPISAATWSYHRLTNAILRKAYGIQE